MIFKKQRELEPDFKGIIYDSLNQYALLYRVNTDNIDRRKYISRTVKGLVRQLKISTKDKIKLYRYYMERRR